MFTRQELENMTRHEIQTLCKENKVRANLKTDAMIELLLATTSNASGSTAHPEQPVRRESTRSRAASRKANSQPQPTIVAARVEEQASEDATTSSRPSRARRVQGAAVHKPARSHSRELVVSDKQAESTIAEEPEPLNTGIPLQVENVHVPSIEQSMEARFGALEGTMQSLKGIPDLVATLIARVNEMENRIETLSQGLDICRTEIAAVKAEQVEKVEQGMVDEPEDRLVGEIPAASSEPAMNIVVPMANTVLGKRQREIDSVNSTPIVGGDDSRRMIQPHRKRARINEVEGYAAPQPSTVHGANRKTADPSSALLVDAGTPPPTNHLPEYYAPKVADLQKLDERAEVEVAGLDFNQATSSTPRDVTMACIDDVPILTAVETAPGLNPTSVRQQRLSGISPLSSMPRPTTPSRPTGYSLFRTTNSQPPIRSAEPVESAGDSAHRRPYVGGSGYPAGDLGDTSHHDYQFSAAMMPVAIGFGLTGGMAVDSPVRPLLRTAYGTERRANGRFTDFDTDPALEGFRRRLP